MRRKLKAAITLPRAATITYDRQATELPRQAIPRVVVVDDPYDPAARIRATTNIRDDPLGRLHDHGVIDDAQFNAGREWQRHYERSQLWPATTLRDPVDGSGASVDALVGIADAIAVIAACGKVLGREGDALIREVLGERHFLATVAIARNLDPTNGSRDMRYLARRLRECLETLAHYFRYA